MLCEIDSLTADTMAGQSPLSVWVETPCILVPDANIEVNKVAAADQAM